MPPSSLSPQPYIEPGTPGYYAPNPVQPDGYPLSLSFLNDGPALDLRRPPTGWPYMQGDEHPRESGASYLSHAIMRDAEGTLLLCVGTDEASGFAVIRLTDLPLRPTVLDPTVLAPLGVASWGRLLELFPPTPASPSIGATLTVVSTPPDGYVRSADVRAALTLPKGTRRTYGNLRKAVEEALDT